MPKSSSCRQSSRRNGLQCLYLCSLVVDIGSCVRRCSMHGRNWAAAPPMDGGGRQKLGKRTVAKMAPRLMTTTRRCYHGALVLLLTIIRNGRTHPRQRGANTLVRRGVMRPAPARKRLDVALGRDGHRHGLCPRGGHRDVSRARRSKGDSAFGLLRHGGRDISAATKLPVCIVIFTIRQYRAPTSIPRAPIPPDRFVSARPPRMRKAFGASASTSTIAGRTKTLRQRGDGLRGGESASRPRFTP